MVLQEERRLISKHQIRHIAGQIEKLSVGYGALQPDIAIWEMMLMQEKQYNMPQHLVLCTYLLSRENLSSKSMLLRQESTLALFTQTKQYCNFVKT